MAKAPPAGTEGSLQHPEPAMVPEADLPGPQEAPGQPAPPARAARRTSAERSPDSGDSGRSSRGVGRPSKDRESTLVELREAIAEDSLYFGAIMGALAPITGLTFIRRGAKFGSAVERIAAREPGVYKAAVKYLKYRAYSELASFGAAVMLAVAVDVGRISPEHPAAQGILGSELAAYQEAVLQSQSAGSEPPNGAPAPGATPAGSRPRPRRTVVAPS